MIQMIRSNDCRIFHTVGSKLGVVLGAACFALASIVVTTSVDAQDVNITQDLPFFEHDTGENFILIERNQDQEARIDDAFAKTSRPCPPFCIHPMSAGEGVETFGELEVIGFIKEYVGTGTGFLIDTRLESWYLGGTIPGSINVSFPTFENPETNPFLAPVLTSLGGTRNPDGTWVFANPKYLTLFCNGPWCDQSPRAIRSLLSVGYPAERLKYYRGGMQSWLMLGLSVETPFPQG
ncbi:MAG: rhodanese-like domain-containing protein [Litoreibacter sp.]